MECKACGKAIYEDDEYITGEFDAIPGWMMEEMQMCGACLEAQDKATEAAYKAHADKVLAEAARYEATLSPAEIEERKRQKEDRWFYGA